MVRGPPPPPPKGTRRSSGWAPAAKAARAVADSLASGERNSLASTQWKETHISFHAAEAAELNAPRVRGAGGGGGGRRRTESLRAWGVTSGLSILSESGVRTSPLRRPEPVSILRIVSTAFLSLSRTQCPMYPYVATRAVCEE